QVILLSKVVWLATVLELPSVLKVALYRCHSLFRFCLVRSSVTMPANVSRLCAGLFTKIVLLKTLIFRIRNLSIEDENPAWGIAVVICRFAFSALMFVC